MERVICCSNCQHCDDLGCRLSISCVNHFHWEASDALIEEVEQEKIMNKVW